MNQPFATVDDIQRLYRPLSSTEQSRAEALLPLVSDEIRVLNGLSKSITDKFRSSLGISAKITLVEPQSIPRSEGKAIRVVDKRNKKPGGLK